MSERTTESPARVLRTRAGTLDHEAYERRARRLRRETLVLLVGRLTRLISTAWSTVLYEAGRLRGRGDRRRSRPTRPLDSLPWPGRVRECGEMNDTGR